MERRRNQGNHPSQGCLRNSCRFREPQVHGLADDQLAGFLAGHDPGAVADLDLDGGRLLVLLRRRWQLREALAVGRQRLDGPDAPRRSHAGLLLSRLGLLVVGFLLARLFVAGLLTLVFGRGLFLWFAGRPADPDLRRNVRAAFSDQLYTHGLADRQFAGFLAFRAGGDPGAPADLDVDGGRLLALFRRQGQQAEALTVGRQRLDGPDAVRLPDFRCAQDLEAGTQVLNLGAPLFQVPRVVADHGRHHDFLAAQD